MKQGWEVKKLGEVCALYQPKTISSKEMLDDGQYPVFGANGIIGKYDKYNHEDPQLLITCRGATCGSVNISEPQSWINGNAMVVRPIDNSLHIKFIEYLFRGGIDISKTITGAAQPQITRQSLSPILISFPKSFSEQQRIVAILDEAFAAIEGAKANAMQNLKNAKELFDSYLQSVFENRGEGWEEKQLSELCDIKHGYAFEGEFFSNAGEFVLLTPGNFYEAGGFRDRGAKQKYYIGQIPAEYVLKKGDLLVAMTEQAAGLLGSPILVPDSDKYLHNQRLGLVKQKSGIPWTNEFFFHVFNTRAVRQAIHNSGSGVKVRHTSPRKIGEVIVSYPISIKEQMKIVNTLQELSAETKRLEAIYQQKIDNLEELKKSILQKAFNGEL